MIAAANQAYSGNITELGRDFPEGFGRLRRWVIDSPIADRSKVLYGVLDDFAGSKDVAWPSHTTLARHLRCSVSSVQRAIRELVELGAVTVERRPFRSNRYVVHATRHSRSTVKGDQFLSVVDDVPF